MNSLLWTRKARFRLILGRTIASLLAEYVHNGEGAHEGQ